MPSYKIGTCLEANKNYFLRFFKIPNEEYNNSKQQDDYAAFLFAENLAPSPLQNCLVETSRQINTEPDFYNIDGEFVIYCKISKNCRRNAEKSISTIYNTAGKAVVDITMDNDNKVIYLPFNIDEVIRNFLFEHYVTPNRKAEFIRKYYNYLQSYIPNLLKMSFRRSFFRRKFAELQTQCNIPSWPIELGLVKFFHYLLRLVLKVAKDHWLPCMAFWPNDRDFCVTLTHDIDSQEGLENVPLVTRIEKQFNFRSSFYFVAELYPIDLSIFNELRGDGFEIGIHGLKHDGRLFSSSGLFYKRAKKINQYVVDWHVDGFRSPSTYRNHKLIKALRIKYDSSYPDTDIYEPQPGGCCSLFPYFIDGIVELPITLPQDHTLFNILKEKSIRLWIDKISTIERFNGMVLMVTHPDYFGNEMWRTSYEQVLAHLASKVNYWHALPKEIASWWYYRDNLDVVCHDKCLIVNDWSEKARLKCAELNKDAISFSNL